MDDVKQKARLLELRHIIDELSYQYYTLDKPTVTDYEYDMMYRELETRPIRRHSASARRFPAALKNTRTTSPCSA